MKKFNKFDTVYENFLKEAPPVSPSPAFSPGTILGPNGAPITPAKAPAAPRASKPGLVDKGIKTAANYVKNLSQNLPQNFADALAGMGGYYSREKDLIVSVSSTEPLKAVIDTNPATIPPGMSTDYTYANLSDDNVKDEFVQALDKLNPEAASRFNNKLSRLNKLKQNYISIKGMQPGTEVLIGIIGNNIYAYYKG